MGYVGSSIAIPFGQMGLQADGSASSLPPNALIKANNVSYQAGRIEKSGGSTKHNSTALPSTNIVGVFDYWPTSTAQRLIAVTSDGKIWRDTGDGTFSSNTAIRNLAVTVTTDCHMATGGQEASGNNKKLFIYTGSAQIHRITGDGSATAAIGTPNTDWSGGNYPTFGGVYANRHFVLGSAANRHIVYFSLTSDHEDFNTTPLTFPIFPGEGDGIIAGIVHRGLLFLFKKPFGVYILDGRDPDTSLWTISKYSDSFGIASPHSVVQALTDMIAANAFGSFTSLEASDKFGDFESGDILSNNGIEDFIRNTFNIAGLPYSQGIYYPEKKWVMFNAQSSSTDVRDRLLVMDLGRENIRFSIESKDEPNCLGLRKDSNSIQRPMYGDQDGYVWLMDRDSYNRDGNPYTGEFQTAYTDFSFADQSLSGKNKIFEFLEVNYVPTGNNNFSCDVYIDGEFRQTISFAQVYGAALDAFELDVDSLAGDPIGRRNRKNLKSCYGNKISFRFYNNIASEGMKIERIIVSFRVGDEAVYSFQV